MRRGSPLHVMALRVFSPGGLGACPQGRILAAGVKMLCLLNLAGSSIPAYRCQNAVLATSLRASFFSDLIPAADAPFSLLGLPDPVPGVLICFYLCRLSAFFVSCWRAAPVILVAALCVVSWWLLFICRSCGSGTIREVWAFAGFRSLFEQLNNNVIRTRELIKVYPIGYRPRYAPQVRLYVALCPWQLPRLFRRSLAHSVRPLVYTKLTNCVWPYTALYSPQTVYISN